MTTNLTTRTCFFTGKNGSKTDLYTLSRIINRLLQYLGYALGNVTLIDSLPVQVCLKSNFQFLICIV